MKPGEFLSRVRHEEVVQAIAQAERKTSGEVRVFVSRNPAPDPLAAAAKQFSKLGMEKTRNRNAVLIFVAPSSNTFAVFGDNAVHEKCGQEFWTVLANAMQERFKAGDFTTGILQGIEKAGDILGQYFPRDPDDRNELSDAVEEA